MVLVLSVYHFDSGDCCLLTWSWTSWSCSAGCCVHTFCSWCWSVLGQTGAVTCSVHFLHLCQFPLAQFCWSDRQVLVSARQSHSELFNRLIKLLCLLISSVLEMKPCGWFWWMFVIQHLTVNKYLNLQVCFGSVLMRRSINQYHYYC